MSRARQQSNKRRTKRTLFGLQNPKPRSTKRTGMRMQVVYLWPLKKKGRKSNRTKWLKRIPTHLGLTRIIYHISESQLKLQLQ